MTEQEYAKSARKFLADSDREFAAGQRQQASEKLYSAANAALTAIAVQRGWEHGTHRDLKFVSVWLADEYSDPFLSSSFAIAENSTKISYMMRWRITSLPLTGRRLMSSSTGRWN